MKRRLSSSKLKFKHIFPLIDAKHHSSLTALFPGKFVVKAEESFSFSTATSSTFNFQSCELPQLFDNGRKAIAPFLIADVSSVIDCRSSSYTIPDNFEYRHNLQLSNENARYSHSDIIQFLLRAWASYLRLWIIHA